MFQNKSFLSYFLKASETICKASEENSVSVGLFSFLSHSFSYLSCLVFINVSLQTSYLSGVNFRQNWLANMEILATASPPSPQIVAWQIRTFYEPLYATGKHSPPSAGLLNSAPVLCCRKKCKPGTSPGLVQQQYSEHINKKQTIVWQFFWCMCLFAGVWQCRREIVFLNRTSPAILQLRKLSRPEAWFARYLT